MFSYVRPPHSEEPPAKPLLVGSAGADGNRRWVHDQHRVWIVDIPRRGWLTRSSSFL